MPDHSHIPNYEERIRKAQAAMSQANVNLLILNFSANFTYLTGTPYPWPNPTGEAFSTDWLRAAILTPGRGPILVTSGEVGEFEGHAATRPGIADVQGYDGLRDPAETTK